MTDKAEFERLLDVYGFRCERFGQDLSTHARAQVVAAFVALATAYAEQAVRPYVDALGKIASEEFISLGEGNVDVRPALSDRDACDLARLTLMGMKDCGACSGTGWVVRDPDIGTDQECFVCGGTGTVQESF